MLYEKWKKVVSERAHEVALFEFSSGCRLTFGELDRRSEAGGSSLTRVVFPRGMGIPFIADVLTGWRENKGVVPIESTQTPPDLEDPPPGIVHLKLTSGTSGKPRTVGFRASQLAADAANIVETMGLRADWPNVGVISLAHSYGFSNLVLPLLLHGIPLILLEAPLPEVLRRVLGTFGAVTMPAVPALWKIWDDANALTDQVKLAISAGAPLPIELETQVFNRTGLKIHNFYGASECGGIAYDRTTVPRQDATCVGSPLLNVLLEIDSDERLIVRGEAVGDAYWPDPAGELNGQRYLTSDLAEIRSGLVYLKGRVGDLINVAGRKLSPEWVEAAIMRQPGVDAVVVFGVADDASRSDRVVACFAGAASVPDLRRFLLTQLPPWQVPKELVKVEKIEANRRGKISRAEWRERWRSRNQNP